ncbi:secreted protein containing duf1501 : Uncharacterized protein OS=Pirellula staleyi (strain ATCC 27377 / DSM 6068 / ICPB 4128) GN=Psta_3333 PE=4 SV=1: DUF1501 [Gemmataceae bacterium]|nr:secreted protein containing duf1501 : Uncharacterized protein OS=Pirellula staleyi (strain ATCC 27377 / DSM 6068 / ICPB 4128) GN=Psta_3333 PE=4 SV=1: DUF1501 [Gemmataceae bacterium]VTU02619.1 secreted protein containing duf1501 : Uncharacterized protein OS=Pirellula staleyi (strain ATCC 27377 / DSM 6068 / ICPB 4128) GN=Psta_3333 PE=4 SV=1: DUF1501 [Gemmataceae bacterium]
MGSPLPHVERPLTRRDALVRGGAGFGGVALSWLLGRDARAAEAKAADPLAAKEPHLKARAKSVIFLFMEGGPSHIDLFDPKPLLNKLHGQKLPGTFKPVILAMGENDAPLMGCKRTFKQHGKGGLWFSDWLPHMATRADDLAVVRSCWMDGINHSGGVCQMNTGSILAGRPSLGSWVSYGLGTENTNLPAFVVMQDNPASVVNGPRNWGAGFMPAVYQGTRLNAGAEPIPNLHTPAAVGTRRQKQKLDYLAKLNQRHADARPDQTELDARIRAYELAFRMQAEAPEAVDLSKESAETLALYGADEKETETFGRQCLLARRLVERGVRFVQLYHGAGSKWDSHSNLDKNHAGLCKSMDKPVAGLLADLKRRGLFHSTLVVWGGEFGRTPQSEQGNGRDHNPYGFTMLMAGAGVRGGRAYGATDELGLHAVEDRLHVHDLHATWLHLLGADHMKLVYKHKGRPERPTLNEGEPFTRLVAG